MNFIVRRGASRLGESRRSARESLVRARSAREPANSTGASRPAPKAGLDGAQQIRAIVRLIGEKNE